MKRTICFVLGVYLLSSVISVRAMRPASNGFELELFGPGIPDREDTGNRKEPAPGAPEEIKIPIIHRLIEANDHVRLRDYVASLSLDQKNLELNQLYKRLSPVSYASKLGFPECLQILLENGARFNNVDCSQSVRDYVAEDVNHLDAEFGVVAIHLAVLGDTAGHTACIDLLCRHNARVHARCIDGETPLHTALWKNNPGHIRVLILHGADYLMPSRSGQLPLDNALPANRVACAQVILLSLLERAIIRHVTQNRVKDLLVGIDIPGLRQIIAEYYI